MKRKCKIGDLIRLPKDHTECLFVVISINVASWTKFRGRILCVHSPDELVSNPYIASDERNFKVYECYLPARLILVSSTPD